MSEYMDDVLQPRSRHSWDVLKKWFRVGPNDIGNGVTKGNGDEPAGSRQQADAPEEGEIVVAADDAVCSAEKRQEEAPNGGSAGVGEGKDGVDQEPIAAAVTTTPAAEAAAVETPVAASADAGQPAAAAVTTDVKAATPAPAAAAPQETEAAGMALTAPTSGATPALEAGAADVSAAGDPVRGSGDSNDTTSAKTGSPGVNGGGGGGWSVVECKIGIDGTCENCGEVLRSVDLSQDEEERLLRQVSAVRYIVHRLRPQWKEKNCVNLCVMLRSRCCPFCLLFCGLDTAPRRQLVY